MFYCRPELQCLTIEIRVYAKKSDQNNKKCKRLEKLGSYVFLKKKKRIRGDLIETFKIISN